MRLVCDHCNATFSVDEAQHGACPRCGSSLAALLPRTGEFTLPPDPLERDGHVTGRYAVPVEAASTLPPDPLERDGHVTGRYAVPAVASTITGEFGAASSPSVRLPPPSAPSPLTDDDLFAPPAPVAAPRAADELSARSVSSLEARLDAAAKALGPAAPAADGPSFPGVDEWRVKKPSGEIQGPFTALELMSRAEAGLIAPDDLVAQGPDGFSPLSAYPLTSTLLSGRRKRRVTAFASTGRAPMPWRGIAGGLMLVVSAAAGALLYTTRPAFLFGAPMPPADIAAMAVLDAWREREPMPIASARELAQLARGYYATDTPESLRRAAETFKRVLMKDGRNLEAMAFYAEVRALLAIEDSDELGLRESGELLGYALRHGGHLAAPHVARANVLAASGVATDMLAAQQEAQKAVAIAPKDPLVQLALARAYIGTNPEYALEALERAKAADPSLRQIPLLFGRAYVAAGRLGDARAALEERQRLVPGDQAADLLLAELDASVGRFDRARRRLADASRRNPRSIDVRLLYAAITYQIDGRLDLARKELEPLRALTLDRRRKLKVIQHLAAIAEQSGRLDEAEALVHAGLEEDAEAAPLHFRMVLIRLQQNRADEIAEHLGKALKPMTDRAQRALLEGRVHAALGETDKAQSAFNRAAVLAPQHAAAYLLNAALFAQIGAQNQSLLYVRRALDADPAWAASHRGLSDFHENDDYVRLALGGIEMMAAGQEESALTYGALAMARYHGGDVPGAEQAARRAVATGQPAVAAQLYLAQIALDRHRPLEALEQAGLAVALDRNVALGHYLGGRALARLGRHDEAHGRFREALEKDPSFLPAMVRDAEALAQLGRTREALDLYRQAYKRDPDDLFLRRGLDALEHGEALPAVEAAIEVPDEP